jgi:tetratricopeptide (TPR) repeat protein
MLAHRDIKPENLLIGEQDVLRITDFGIASASSSKGDTSGTPFYKAPEQWNGEEQTGQTDLYAFGVVLHELCFGSFPWKARSEPELFYAHTRERPHIAEHPLKQVIETCLEKSPANRLASAETLHDMLKTVARRVHLDLPPRSKPLDDEQSELMARASLGAVGDASTALRAAETLAQRWPDYAPGWTQLGRILQDLGRFQEAEKATRKSLEIDPTRSSPWNNLGVLLADRGTNDAAVEAFKRALDADPYNTGAMSNIAKPLSELNRHGEVVQYLTVATELAPDKYNLWVNLGSTYSLIDSSKAAECLRRGLDLAPSEKRAEIQAFLNRVLANPKTQRPGSALLAEGRIAEAIPLLTAEAKSEPNNPSAIQNLAIALLQTGDGRGAVEAFERLHRLEPINDFAWMNLMRLASKRGDLPEAERWCKKFANMPGMLGRSKAFWAHILEENGQLQTARSLLLAAMKEHPNEPDVFIAYGDLALKNRVPGHAVNAYHTALQIMKARPHQVEYLRSIEQKLQNAEKATREES